ncbi:hypothetical protein [Kamptonema sp. UHCC 0994]|uniref:hypothetical protein n=1 Tax=Kamptonema sp. UHCC 0994 TaxID=3031329 RepID=UPI0023BA0FD5|nr:hypothetical protein [Kamptonema sp. UHCC 0994]MDF0553254.1 hypothetical protein [Kamptonema sp. UHCC 0994]
MNFQISISPRRIAASLSIWVLFFGVAGFVVQVLRYGFNYRERWINLFNLDLELNYPSWYQSFTLLFCAILLGVIASAKKKQSDRYFPHWKALSIIFVLLALDESLSFHELLIIPDLRKALHLGGLFYFIWVIPGAAFVLVTALNYFKFLLYLPSRTRYLFILAGCIYVGGALGMEMVGGYYADLAGQRNLIYGTIATTEEIFEMVGVLIFIYALLAYIGSYIQDIDVRFKVLDDREK